ncbi:hypothetical protein HAX54_012261 [Datura stramonium]|uniref:Uncharacterized protein n=1 Tax=Datura stramonium TaxID=4076 RepID=A0ABS8TL75_DATST|nr:hypothetical protein [Datura stramonium]
MIEGVVSSLGADVRELKSKAPLSRTDLSSLDEAMVSPHIARGPIDVMLEAFGKDEKVEHADDGGEGAGASGDAED